MDYRTEIKFCQRVLEYAKWKHAGEKGEAPYVEGLPARYRLLVELLTPYNVRPLTCLHPVQLWLHVNHARVPHIPLTEATDAEAALELARRYGVNSSSSGGRASSSGGFRLK